MAADRRAVEPRKLRAIQPDWRPNCGSYEHRGDGRRGDKKSAHYDCERHILAEWHRSSADNGNFLEGAWPLRTRGTLTLIDGSNPQNDADAGAKTRGASAGDAAEGAPACRRGRGYYDL